MPHLRFTPIPIIAAAFALSFFQAELVRLHAQAPVPATTPAPARQLGTVKSISGNTLTIAPTTGAPVTVTVAPNAPVLQLPPGSTDLKSATPSTLDQIAVGDRILATGKPGEPGAILASRIILMKSSDLAARSEQQQADWQRRGVSGLVKSVDTKSADGPAALTLTSGTRTVTVQTTPTTVIRRYADDSVNFQEAKSGTLAQILPGDQLSVRGPHSDDNLTVTAEEIVFGSFSNLSGLVTAVDPTAGTISLRDLATKKLVTVKITTNSDLRNLPPQAAAAFAARNNPNASAATSGSGANGQGAAQGRPAGAYGAGAARQGASAASAPAGPAGGGGRARAGMDLSRMLARLPAEPLTDLRPGQAVMIVASQPPGSTTYTAITLLSGVEPLLAGTATGAQPITLSPWNLSAPEGGGGGGSQ